VRRPWLVLLLVVATACSDGDGIGGGTGDGTGPATTSSGDTPAAPGPPADLAKASFKLAKVADLSSPVAMAVRPDDDSIYVAEKGGRVRKVTRGQTANPGGVDGTAVLDLRTEVSTGGEQGLLGLAFSPDGGKLYVNYTDRAGDTRVVEYTFRDGRADTGTARELLFVDQPFANHNGGEVVFGPDGKLYIGLGDGGSGNDPQNRAQNLGDLLGKLLRIDPTPSGEKPYTIPPDNPFASGQSGARPEVWMYGLRNPWRFSWDREANDLWIGDVGQNAVEEVDFLAGAQPGGTNFGWSQVEGSRRVKGANPDGAVLPLHEYGHDDGCSVTGGYVYRGSKVPALRGIYLYGDACSGKVWGLTQQGGRATGNRELAGESEVGGSGSFSIASFGEDSNGELYVLNLGGPLLRIEAA